MALIRVVKNKCLVCGTRFKDGEIVMFVEPVWHGSPDKYCENQEPHGGIHRRCFDDRVKPVEATA